MISLTFEQLQAITPRAETNRLATLRPHIIDTCEKYAIDTPIRVAAFIAQWAHETQEWRHLEEVWGPTAQQQKYERPIGRDGIVAKAATDGEKKPLWQRLGNFAPGDGYLYRGRGLCMLTGRENYDRASTGTGMRLLDAPDIVSRLDVGTEVAGWYWRDRRLNEPADKGDFATVTLRVNGGRTHLERRLSYYRKACEVLGVA